MTITLLLYNHALRMYYYITSKADFLGDWILIDAMKLDPNQLF